ncbi:MAG: sulfurtransferase TusA family protein [Spartobacteria bacterium]|nr:sulfurtransferase TusA family protein [Spartobacteria bacterium]
MSTSRINLCDEICPFVVVDIVRESLKMPAGSTRTFIVDDPLAIKSVPEELEEHGGFSVTVEKHEDGWMITVVRAE